jgi:hypothetical protein
VRCDEGAPGSQPPQHRASHFPNPIFSVIRLRPHVLVCLMFGRLPVGQSPRIVQVADKILRFRARCRRRVHGAPQSARPFLGKRCPNNASVRSINIVLTRLIETKADVFRFIASFVLPSVKYCMSVALTTRISSMFPPP